MKTTVTRRDVLKALRTEPLRGGTYVHVGSVDSKLFKNNSQCAVCAVGSILDLSIGHKFSAEEMDSIGCGLVKTPVAMNTELSVKEIVEDATAASQNGYPLSGLSILFEGLFVKSHYRTKGHLANSKLRLRLVKFVKKNFPAKLTFDTDSGREY